MPGIMDVMNVATLHKTAPTRFLPQEHPTTKTDLIQGIDIPTSKGTGHTPPIMVPDMGHILIDCSPAAILTVVESAISEGTPCTPNQTTAAGHITLWPIDTPITTHAITPTCIVTPHPALDTSPPDVTHATP